jgi:hypothetical protein
MQTLMVPMLLEEPVECEERLVPWGPPARGLASQDLVRIFNDIIDTAITRAAGIPCSLDEYRQGLDLMVRRLGSTIGSLPVFPPGMESARPGSFASSPIRLP